MKKLLSTLILAFIFAVAAAAQSTDSPAIAFDQTKVNLGSIHANGGSVTATYHFTNTGSRPLVIKKVTNGGCGCTTPSYPKKPIAPGEGGDIVIRFNPEGRRGEFNREVKVSTNADSKRQSLRFSGTIIP